MQIVRLFFLCKPRGNLEKPTARASLALASLALHEQSCVSRRNICAARYGLSKSPRNTVLLVQEMPVQ